MRLIGILNNERQAREFSGFLEKEGILNQCDIERDDNWGSAAYGTTSCKIWIQEEEQLEPAIQFFESFQEDPENPKFYGHGKKLRESIDIREAQEKLYQMNKKARTWSRQSMGLVTFYTLMICVFIYGFDSYTRPTITKVPTGIPVAPLLMSPVEKKLLYDYPEAYEIVDRGMMVSALPPYWQGGYDKLVQFFSGKQVTNDAPLFEKIRQGEWWRLFSPALLHANWIHIFFNLVWFMILGKQMEIRLGSGRYLLFILLAGIFSNTAQYLTSGSNFIGISGVIAAMCGFIWMRQKVTPWEGYRLDGSTAAFLALFIGGMFVMQLVSFVLEVTIQTALPLNIANTAHLSGAFLGMLLGRFNLFAWKGS